jgi:hypothetical protein
MADEPSPALSGPEWAALLTRPEGLQHLREQFAALEAKGDPAS